MQLRYAATPGPGLTQSPAHERKVASNKPTHNERVEQDNSYILTVFRFVILLARFE